MPDKHSKRLYTSCRLIDALAFRDGISPFGLGYLAFKGGRQLLIQFASVLLEQYPGGGVFRLSERLNFGDGDAKRAKRRPQRRSLLRDEISKGSRIV
jgi:hypothetical protein